MKKEIKIAVFLFFLSPALGELLTGSSPPLEFFNPFILILLAFLYGGGTLLIREAKAKWNLQWSVIFLAIAYGIVEEGLCVKSFFNPGWVDMGPLSAYGMYFGVQWVWILELIFYHATISTLIPIAIAGLMWPDYKNKPILGKRSLVFLFTGLIFVTIYGMIFFGTMENGRMVPYYPNPLLLIGSFISVLLLVWLARISRNSRISPGGPLLPPAAFGIFGFLFQIYNILVPSILAGPGIPATITLPVQFVGIFFLSLFGFFQFLHKRITKRHTVSFIFGSLLFWILLTPIQEFVNHMPGMFAVGIIAFISLIIWRRKVLKNKAVK